MRDHEVFLGTLGHTNLPCGIFPSSQGFFSDKSEKSGLKDLPENHPYKLRNLNSQIKLVLP